MKIVSLAEVKAKLSAYLQEAEKSGPSGISFRVTSWGPSCHRHSKSRTTSSAGLSARCVSPASLAPSISHSKRNGLLSTGPLFTTWPLKVARVPLGGQSGSVLGLRRKTPFSFGSYPTLP